MTEADKEMGKDPLVSHLLRGLHESPPSAAVKARIVEGALSRTKTNPSGAFFGRTFPWTALGVGALVLGGVWLGLGALDDSPATIATAPSPTLKNRGSLVEVAQMRRESIGAHLIWTSPQARWSKTENDDGVLVQLQEGEGRYEVEPLTEGRTFRIRTPHAEVTVVGTVFDVVAGDCTQVGVTEGKVRVASKSGEVIVAPGNELTVCELWSQDKPPAAKHEIHRPREAHSVPQKEVAPTLSDAEELDQALALFREGQAGRRASYGKAASRLERFVDRYPQSVLVPDAHFYRAMSLLFAQDPLAAQAAEDFLQRYPSGRRADAIRKIFTPSAQVGDQN